MENKKFFINGIISFFVTIGLVVIGAFIFNKCTNGSIEKVILNGKKYQVLKTVRDTVYITKTLTKYTKGENIFYTEFVKQPSKTDTITITKVDTIRIVNDYSTYRKYVDTLTFDNGNIIIIDTLYRNKIDSRNWVSNFREKTITETKYIQEIPKNKFYYGINLSTNQLYNFNSVSGSLLLKTKKEKIITFSLGVDKNAQPILTLGYYLKFK